MSVKDSMTTVRVTEDLAAGSGRSLEEATNALIEAEHGRLVGLEAMGILTKQQVKDGLTFDQVLQQIESHMGGAASAATATYSGALSQLSATWEKLLEDAGTPFLGALAKVAGGFSDVVRVVDQDLQPTLDLFAEWAKSEGPNIAQAFGHITDDAQDMVTYFQGDVFPEIAALWTAFGNLRDAVSGADKAAGQHSGWDDLRDAIKDVADMISFTLGLLTEAVNKMADLSKWQQNLPFGVRELVGLLPPFAALPGSIPGENPSQTLPPDNASGGFAWMQAHNANVAAAAKPSTSTSYNPKLGGTQSHSGTGYVEPSSAMETNQTKLDTEATQEAAVVKQFLAEMSQSAAASEDELANKMKLATTVAEYNADAQELNAKKMADLTDEIAVLRGALAQETPMQNQYTAAVNEASEAHTAAVAKLKAYESSAEGAKKQTLAWKEGNEQLTASVHNTQSALEDAQKALKTVTDEIAKHNASLATVMKAYNDLKNAPAETLAAISRKWEEFNNKSQQAMQEDLATFAMTDSQKVAFYLSDLNQMASIRDNAADQENALEAKLLEAFKEKNTQKVAFYSTMMGNLVTISQQAEQRQEQDESKLIQSEEQLYSNFYSTASSKMSSFLDTIVVEHKSMADALKTVYQDIEKYFIDMLAQMLARAIAAMPIFQSILGFLGIGGGGIPGIGGVVPTQPGGLLGWGSNASVGSGASSSSALASIASSPAIAGAMASAMSPSGGGGGSVAGAVSPDLGFGGAPGGGPITPGQLNALPYSPGAGGAQPYSQNASASPLGLSQALNSVLKGPIGKIGLGFGIGDMAAEATGGNSLWGSLGGGLGAGLGLLLHANPLIGLGIDLLMGLAGSLFGNHFNPADEPDISQTDAWGQANADMQGMTAADPMNANGKQFTMDGQTAQATGGRGWNIMMEKFVQQYRGNLSTLPYTLQSAFPNIEQLWGGATDKQYFNPDGKDGYLDIGSGKRALWSDFWGVITEYGQSISSLMQNQTPTEMYVTNVNGLMRSIGGGTPTPGGSDSPFTMGPPGGGSGSNSVASGGPGRIGASLAQRLSQSIAINVNVNNSSTLTDTANLSRALRDAFGTTLPSALEDLNIR
jgi:hypothetical protein